MGVGWLVIREILHRRLGFALGVLGIAVAAGCLAAQTTLLKKHDLRTERIIAAKEAETKQTMAKMEDDTRQITVNMGFNLLILPKEQKASDLYDEEVPLRTMPEEYADRLARNRVATINHVLPSLTQRIKWPEQRRKIMLMGVRGEVYIKSAQQKQILEPVPPGTAVLGYELHTSLGLKVGDPVTLLGRSFEVGKLREERGNWDDVTVWINLAAAQEMLERPKQINAILALECNCEADRLSRIRAEVSSILPDTQVVEFATQAIARSEMRKRAAAESLAAVERERAGRSNLRAQREAFAAVLVPLVMLAAAVWIALLTLGNARDRQSEIGILRALGLRTGQVLGLFLGRAVLTGLLGGAAGLLGGTAAGLAWQGLPDGAEALRLLDPWTALLALLAAPLLAVLAAWVPALWAAREDPAVILQRE